MLLPILPSELPRRDAAASLIFAGRVERTAQASGEQFRLAAVASALQDACKASEAALRSAGIRGSQRGAAARIGSAGSKPGAFDSRLGRPVLLSLLVRIIVENKIGSFDL